ncbi:MAG: SlyX family protein [Pseudomonadota bacterium]
MSTTEQPSSSLQRLESSVAELESRLEFQDSTISTLNDELVAHQKIILTLQKQLALVLKRLPEKDTLDHDPESEPPPPHY